MEFISGFLLGCFISAFLGIMWHKGIIQRRVADALKSAGEKADELIGK